MSGHSEDDFLFRPEAAHCEPGPCPVCGAETDVFSVRSKTDRGWWNEWKGCIGCVTPLAFATQIMDLNGAYTLIMPGGPKPRRPRR